MTTLKLAVIADIHAGIDARNEYGGHKLGSWAPVLMPQFVSVTNAWEPDATINLGDDITAIRDGYDNQSSNFHALRKMINENFGHLESPLYAGYGNHCDALADITDDPVNFPKNPPSQVITIKGYNIIMWNPNPDVWEEGKRQIDAPHKQWLKEQLQTLQGPSVLVFHAPVSTYRRDHEIQGLINNNGNVILCLNGHKHVHLLSTEQPGPPVYLQQSLTEKQKGTAFPWGAYSFVEIDDQTITIHSRNLMSTCEQGVTYRIPRHHDTQERNVTLERYFDPSCAPE